MVASVTNYGRSGVHDHLIQRLSAIIIAAYTLFLFGFVVLNPDLQYQQWHDLFASTWVKVFSLASLISICAHAWVGLWTVATDYMKGAVVRLSFLSFLGAALFTYMIWGIQILWSV